MYFLQPQTHHARKQQFITCVYYKGLNLAGEQVEEFSLENPTGNKCSEKLHTNSSSNVIHLIWIKVQWFLRKFRIQGRYVRVVVIITGIVHKTGFSTYIGIFVLSGSAAWKKLVPGTVAIGNVELSTDHPIPPSHFWVDCFPVPVVSTVTTFCSPACRNQHVFSHPGLLKFYLNCWIVHLLKDVII